MLVIKSNFLFLMQNVLLSAISHSNIDIRIVTKNIAVHRCIVAALVSRCSRKAALNQFDQKHNPGVQKCDKILQKSTKLLNLSLCV